MAEQALYFIAIIPPADIADEVSEFKQIAADRFNSSHAFNSPPHITIVPPFRFDNFALLDREILRISKQAPSFPVFLNNFDHFDNRVIFVNITENEKLKRCNQIYVNNLSTIIDKRLDNRFHAHMTVAFRDLSPDMFIRAWEVYRNIKYERYFTADQVCLLRHRNKKWVMRRFYPLAG